VRYNAGFMGFLDKILRRDARRRVFVLGIDGVPYTFVDRLIGEGLLPNFGRLRDAGAFRRIHSVQPCVSSVAWASYMTGKNPGKHGILGFVDRKLGTDRLDFPNGGSMRSETLWEILSRAGKRVVVMNVPCTFPPRAVNGLMVGGFLSPHVKKATHPRELGGELEAMGYRLDVDASLAKTSLTKLGEDAHHVLTKRIEAMRYLLAKEPEWDFAQMHVMATDRLNHFMWKHHAAGDAEVSRPFLDLYRRVDAFVGDLLDKELGADDDLIVMSDHGFCTIKRQVMLNHYLAEKGYLRFRDETANGLGNIDPASTAFSLIPGRIYVNLAGREHGGQVDMAEYEALRTRLRDDLLALKDPETGEAVIEEVHLRESIFWDNTVAGPTDRGGYDILSVCRDTPDLVAAPHDGYDLKAPLKPTPSLVHTDELIGMHTVHDALLFWRGRELRDDFLSVVDVMPAILDVMGVPVPSDVDGRSALAR